MNITPTGGLTTAWYQGDGDWKATFKNTILDWLKANDRDFANPNAEQSFRLNCDQIFKLLDSGQVNTPDQMNAHLDVFKRLFTSSDGRSIYEGDVSFSHQESSQVYQHLQQLFKSLSALGVKVSPDDVPEPHVSELFQFKNDVDCSWLHTLIGEEGYDPGTGQGAQGYIRQNIFNPIFSEIDQHHITTIPDLQKFINGDQHLKSLLGPDIWNNDPSYKALVAKGDQAGLAKAYSELQDVYQKLWLDPNLAPKPPSGPPGPPVPPVPPPSAGTIRVMTLNVRTSDASRPHGEDALNGPNSEHYWTKRQGPLAKEILAQSPTIINLQEATKVQIEGGRDPLDPQGLAGTGLLDLLNANQPGRYQVVYMNNDQGDRDDAIIYDTTKLKLTANQWTPSGSAGLASGDGWGQRYAHVVAFQDKTSGRNVVVGNAHAQMWSAGGLTADDANKISSLMQSVGASHKNADGSPPTYIFTADSNRPDLNDTGGQAGESVQSNLEKGLGMKNAVDLNPQYKGQSTSGLWDGPGLHGKQEDVIYTSGQLSNFTEGDRTATQKSNASDHVTVSCDVKI